MLQPPMAWGGLKESALSVCAVHRLLSLGLRLKSVGAQGTD